MVAKALRLVHDNIRKVFLVFACTICALAISTNVALAQEQTQRIEVPVTIGPGTPGSITNTGDLLAGTAGSISNGSGSLPCYLLSGNYWVEFQASTGYNGGISGTVTCFVEFPSGDTYDIGMISASNGCTSRHEFFYCPAGTYTFIYEASTTAELDVAGFMYD